MKVAETLFVYIFIDSYPSLFACYNALRALVFLCVSAPHSGGECNKHPVCIIYYSMILVQSCFALFLHDHYNALELRQIMAVSVAKALVICCCKENPTGWFGRSMVLGDAS